MPKSSRINQEKNYYRFIRTYFESLKNIRNDPPRGWDMEK